MSPEESLSVKLAVRNRRVAEVEIASTRLVRPARALSGRPPEEVLALVPLLFPVCGIAHGVACARALEAALGRTPDPKLEAARETMCLGEAAVAHAWQLAIAWPEAAGAPGDTESVRTARRALTALARALFGKDQLAPALRPDPAIEDAKGAVTTLVALLDMLTAREAPLLACVKRAEQAGFGVSPTPTVAALDVAATGALLAADPAFAAHPELEGGPVDVSAYARRCGCDDLRAIEAVHGRGLLARLAARREDARAAMHRLAAAFAEPKAVPLAAAAGGIAGGGAGGADTARGPLVYWVRASPERVEDVRVVAPTDWTFHPRGALRSALLGVESRPTLARDAGWLVLALDPCVPWTIEVNDA